MEIITGDLLAATEDYIVQQCCCTAVRPAGLSKAIAEKFADANPYANRHPLKKGGNTATESERAVPGKCKIIGARKVACLYGQYAQGKPGYAEVPDYAKDRQGYFESALLDLISQIPPDASLAVPYKIGCGMAGGNWSIYLGILQKIADNHPSLKIRIYRLNSDT